MDKDIERFISYTKIDTQSNDDSNTYPSDPKELNLTRLVEKECQALGIPCQIDEFGILYGKLEGESKLEAIGLNAHVDTAGEISGKDVTPRLIKDYDGGVIHLDSEHFMSPKEFASLGEHIGDDLIVTGGKTLLGADDKAGVSLIVATLEYFVKHPEVKHNTICFCITPDEEIGRGSLHFDAKKFGAEYAYTVDGGPALEVNDENFNAAHADIVFHGVSIHPGSAKGKMVNASSLAIMFDRKLPPLERPEYTENREGFNHLIEMKGSTDEAELHYIIRNHDLKKLEAQKQRFLLIAKEIQERYPSAKVEISVGDDYRNMKEVFSKDPRAINKIKKTFQKLNLVPTFKPIRGGTDGASFSFKGCPTPNLGTGAYNFHGRYEYLSVREYRQMEQILIALFSC